MKHELGPLPEPAISFSQVGEGTMRCTCRTWPHYPECGGAFGPDQMHAYAAQEVAKAVAALSNDAERYRWLRQQDWESGALCVVRNPKIAIKLGHDAPSLFRLDAAIDAAMERT